MTAQQKKTDSDSADPRYKTLYRLGGIVGIVSSVPWCLLLARDLFRMAGEGQTTPESSRSNAS